MRSRKPVPYLAIITAVLLTACGTTPPTTFYTLSAEAQGEAGARDARAIVVGIGPVEVAPYLERSQIVRRTGRTRLQLAEYDRWAEPIENNIASVLSDNLARLMPTIQPIVRPWSEAGAEYHVLVKVLRFDSDADGRVVLNVDWGIQQDGSHSMPVVRRTRIEQMSEGSDYDSITRAMSAALTVLSEAIAVELSKMIPERGGGK